MAETGTEGASTRVHAAVACGGQMGVQHDHRMEPSSHAGNFTSAEKLAFTVEI